MSDIEPIEAIEAPPAPEESANNADVAVNMTGKGFMGLVSFFEFHIDFMVILRIDSEVLKIRRK